MIAGYHISRKPPQDTNYAVLIPLIGDEKADKRDFRDDNEEVVIAQ